MHTDALKPIGTKVAQSRTKPYKALCGPAVNFQRLNTACSVSYISCTRSCILRTTVAPHLSLYFQCIAAAETLWDSGFPRVLCYSYPHMRGSEVRSLLSPDHHEPLCSCSPPCLSVFLGGITPCKFPSGRLGQLPTIGWFWAGRIRTRGVS